MRLVANVEAVRLATARCFRNRYRTPNRVSAWPWRLQKTGRVAGSGWRVGSAARSLRRRSAVRGQIGHRRPLFPFPTSRTCAGGSSRRSPTRRVTISCTRAPVLCQQGIVALARARRAINASQERLDLGLLQIVDGRLASPPLKREAQHALESLQMFRMARDDKAGERVDSGEPGVARGDAVAPLGLQGVEESPDPLGAEVRKLQGFNGARHSRAVNCNSNTKASR